MMRFLEIVFLRMQYSIFGLLALVSVVAGLYAPVWPVWDAVEGNFVRSLLTTMPGEPDTSGAWYGAAVQGDDTVLVSGILHALHMPHDPRNDDVFEQCVALRRNVEVLTLSLQWKIKGTTSFIGEGIKIADWHVDPLFLNSAVVPATRSEKYSWDNHTMTCPKRREGGSYRFCRHVDYCVTAEDHAILGVIGKTANGERIVQLPNETLHDYPLMQRGFYTPQTFSYAYRDSMQKRIPVYPLFVAMVQLIAAVLMLSIANGAMEQGIKESFRGDIFYFQRMSLLWFNSHLGLIRFLYGLVLGPLIRQNKSLRSSEWRATILGLALPALPLLGYKVLVINVLFIIVLAAYATGFFYYMYLVSAWFYRTHIKSTESSGG